MSNPFGGIGAICVSKLRTLHADVPTFSLLMFVIISSCWTCLTLFNLLTLGIVQASLSLLSLNRKFQHLTASLFLSFSADRSWNELFAFAHRKHLIFFEWGMVRMTFVYSPLTAHRSPLIACQWKSFTKPNFRINPAGKSKVPSWKIFISQLENYFFSVGKSKFRSWAI